jgi:tetratricopeptide (TPR) repeat protein
MKLKFVLALALFGSSVFASYADGYKDGVEYFQAGQEENAEIVLLQTLDEAATDKAEAYYYLGWIELNKGNLDKASEYFELGVKANPEYAYNYVGKGAVALKKGNVDAAKDFFKEAEKINKKDAKIRVDIARAYYNADKVKYNKQWNDALKDAKKKDKKESAIYIFEGDVFADEQKYGDSAGYYEMAITFDAERPIAYVKYANTYFRINPTVAIQKLEEIVAKNPNSALAQRELAEKYYENNQWTKAAEQYKNVIDNPNHFASDDERYVVLLYFGKNYQESLSRAQAQLQKTPTSFLMKRMVFLNQAALEQYAEAEKSAIDFFGSASADNLLSSNDYTTYGDVLKKLGKEEEALGEYEKAVEINPDKVELLKDLSSAYSTAATATTDSVKAANYHLKSAELYKKFIDKGDYSTNDLFVLAGRYQNVIATALNDTLKSKAFEKANKVIDEVLERVPDDYRIAQRKARIALTYEGNDRSKGLAVAPYNQMMEILNNDTTIDESKKKEAFMEAYMYIAAHYLAIKDSATAKSYYLKYLELDPTNEALKKYIENMK